MKKIIINIGIDTIILKLKGKSGSIETSLKDEDSRHIEYNSAIEGIESLILAHACAGINIEDPQYIEGIKTALDAIANNL